MHSLNTNATEHLERENNVCKISASRFEYLGPLGLQLYLTSYRFAAPHRHPIPRKQSSISSREKTLDLLPQQEDVNSWKQRLPTKPFNKLLLC